MHAVRSLKRGATRTSDDRVSNGRSSLICLLGSPETEQIIFMDFASFSSPHPYRAVGYAPALDYLGLDRAAAAAAAGALDGERW